MSIAHTNHAENETKLLSCFAPNRKEGTELFDIGLDSFIAALQSGMIEFLDESEKLKGKGKAFLDGMKKFMMGGFNQCLANQSDATASELLSDSLDILEVPICLTPEAADRLAIAVQERVQAAWTEPFQKLCARVEALEDAVTDPFHFVPAVPAPLPAGGAPEAAHPGRDYMKRWMRTASDKLGLLTNKFNMGSNAILHKLYGYLEADFGVDLEDERLRIMEQFGLEDCSTLKAVFYDEDLRDRLEELIDYNLAPENRGW